MSLVRIDGSLGEGGGQVLRIALSLSALYKIPVEIQNIRAGRPKPGLAAQHLTGVQLLTDMCQADVKGAHIGSTSLEFWPKQLSGHKLQYTVDTGTAGCICLILQVALPCILFTETQSTISLLLRGGTNVPMGPQIEYFTEVFKPLLNKFGADFDFEVTRRGYYPKGGGEVELWVKPIDYLNPITLINLGVPREIEGWSYVAGVVHINEAYKMENDAKNVLTEEFKKLNISFPPITIESYKENKDAAVGNGSGINIVCKTSTECILGGSGLGSGRNSNPPPGVVAGNQLLDPFLTDSCVDEHTQDQLIIFMALAKGVSKIKIGRKKLSTHTETAMKVAEMMLASRGLRFKLYESEDGNNTQILECEGCGLINKRSN